VDICNYDALKFIGISYPPTKLVSILLKDKIFYSSSDGGVTFAGGDPLLHSEYLATVCKELKKHDIHIAVQTCGNFNFELFKQSVQPYIDLIYFDLRILNSEKYFHHTGQSNGPILENLKKLTTDKKQIIIVRTPLIPGVTDTQENLDEIDLYIRDLDIDGYQTINYNPIEQKVTSL
jgi:pyruvate formate lyase activating enzyme